MQKRGKTAAGTQRWLCLHCTRSHALGHETQQQDRQLDRFVDWLLGKKSQTELGVSDRTWRAQTAWCWQVVPKPILTGETYPVLLLDGIRVGSLVCLIARTPEYVIAWTWVPYEAGTTWDELLGRLPPPVVVVCDGQKGILLSISRNWPQAAIQRCHFHVWQNVRGKLTLFPQTEAGRHLLLLTKVLLKGLHTTEAAERWKAKLATWEELYGGFIRERTVTSNPRPGQRKWRYTHERLRSAYRQLTKLVRDEQLFTYLDGQLLQQTQRPIPRTTNYVEGGINSQLRTKLKLHRGMSEEHQRRLVEWYLYTRTEAPKPPRNCR